MRCSEDEMVAGGVPGARRRRPGRDNQRALVGVAPTTSPPSTPTAAPPLARSPLLLARAPRAADQHRVVAAVDFLRARNGVADAAAFAAVLGEFPARVGGVVARLQEVLNVDGYQVLRYDRGALQVHLDVDKLTQQFELGA